MNLHSDELRGSPTWRHARRPDQQYVIERFPCRSSTAHGWGRAPWSEGPLAPVLRRTLGRQDTGSSERWPVRTRTEDKLLQTLSPRARLALPVELRPPRSAEVFAHAGRLGQRRAWIQALETAIHLDVHAVLVSALPDVCVGVRFFAPARPTAETTTHRAARRIVRLGCRLVLHCLLVFVAHIWHSIRFIRGGLVVAVRLRTHGHSR